MSPVLRSTISAPPRRPPIRAGSKIGRGLPLCPCWSASRFTAPARANSRQLSCGLAMPAETPLRDPTREAGSITLFALWAVALIGFLLAAASLTIRTELRTTVNALGEAQARLAAEAGTRLGLARLVRRRGE